MKRTISVNVSDWRLNDGIFYNGTGVTEQFKIRISEVVYLEILGLEKKIPCEIQVLHFNDDSKNASYISVKIEDEVVTNFSVKSYDRNIYIHYFIKNPKHCIFQSIYYDCGGKLKLDVTFDETKIPPPKTTLDRIRLKMFDPPSNEPDFSIICKDDGKKSLKFHKNYLCQFSGYFQRMLENPTLRESQKNEMVIPNCSIKTLTTFRKILYEKLRI